MVQEERASSTDTVFQGAGWDEEGRRREERSRTKSETRGRGVEEVRRGVEEGRPPSREGVIDLLRGNTRRPLEVGRRLRKKQSAQKSSPCIDLQFTDYLYSCQVYQHKLQ